MLQPEKDALLAELLGGRETEAYKAATAQIATTDKAAQEQGVVYKDDSSLPVYEIEGQPYTLKAGRLIALKAPMPPAEMVEAGDTEAVDGATEEVDETELMDDGGGDEPLFGPADIEVLRPMVREEISAALAPLAGMMDFEKKMSDHVGKLMGGYAQKDDAREQRLKALEAELAVLKGEQPRRRMAAQVWGDLTRQGAVEVTKEQAEQLTATPPQQEVPAELNEQERGAYMMIFGNQ